jgi:hypothetical protein
MMTGKRTIDDIRILDLLQYLWPDCRMTLLVFFKTFGPEVDYLSHAPRFGAVLQSL